MFVVPSTDGVTTNLLLCLSGEGVKSTAAIVLVTPSVRVDGYADGEEDQGGCTSAPTPSNGGEDVGGVKALDAPPQKSPGR